MRFLASALLYTALVMGANIMGANPALADVDAARAAQAGDMRKLTFHDAPRALPVTKFQSFDGGEADLAQYNGKWVLLNFWATWCAPCRAEMPALDALEAAQGGDAFAVVTIASGPNAPEAMQRFFDEAGVTRLPLHRDPKQGIARNAAVLAMPTTLLLDPEGREVARMTGEADWAGDDALALITALIGNE